MPMNDVPTAATLKQSNRAEALPPRFWETASSGSVIFPPVRARMTVFQLKNITNGIEDPIRIDFLICFISPCKNVHTMGIKS